MTWDQRNLADTVRAHKVRAECTVGWAIDPYANGGRTWTWCHQWGKDGRCLHCHKTVAQVLVPAALKYGKPEPPAGSTAHLERALESGE